MNRILISKDIYDRNITKKFVKETAEKILKELTLDNVELSITLTDNETIKQINKQWRNKDKPTDVLSFPIDEKPAGYRYRVLGDVVISLPYAKKQAEEIGIPYKNEIVRLLTHGILHLLGYDHEVCPAEAKKMFDLQDRIFEKITSSHIQQGNS
ncbi:probable rRNA maturation factor [Persephonella hydrogeniphila]|uniref:Endoribonuclease YbeY n=1 Tax=Persephonella hydrogeniphila TaxID=198703 RepID=A0A285NA96_9AQUI|nr:rRNA maturation RNase YbeY [Persephonella hydrogeniphila]SNZ06360.1 probable rRNA maturation factor [Persephonella hydrogeniphila]